MTTHTGMPRRVHSVTKLGHTSSSARATSPVARRPGNGAPSRRGREGSAPRGGGSRTATARAPHRCRWCCSRPPGRGGQPASHFRGRGDLAHADAVHQARSAAGTGRAAFVAPPHARNGPSSRSSTSLSRAGRWSCPTTPPSWTRCSCRWRSAARSISCRPSWRSREGGWDGSTSSLGAVPKRKFTADPRAILRLRRWRDLGGSIGLFPEGERTWDGRPLPILPGVEKLVRVMDLPVVDGPRVQRLAAVRRAGRPRCGAAACTSRRDPPRRFAPGDSLESIPPLHRGAHQRGRRGWAGLGRCAGRRLAAGIGNVLFACPACLRLDAIEERGDHRVLPGLRRSVACGYRVAGSTPRAGGGR